MNREKTYLQLLLDLTKAINYQKMQDMISGLGGQTKGPS